MLRKTLCGHIQRGWRSTSATSSAATTLKRQFSAVRSTTSNGVETLHLVNPTTEEDLPSIRLDTPAEVDGKIESAHRSQKDWADAPLDETPKTGQRKKVLESFAQKLEDRSQELAGILHTEIGKPLSQARGEILATRGRIKFFIDHVDEVVKPRLMFQSNSMVEKVEYEPMGVVANISAWNYPYFVASNVFGAALVTGNSVVYKPSEHSIDSALQIKNLLLESELPENVFQVVLGTGHAGSILAADSRVKGVFFTGSRNTGQKIARTVSERPHSRLQLELGGTDSLYVRRDIAELDRGIEKAAKEILWGSLYNAGQSCCAVQRVLVAKEVASHLMDAIENELQQVKLGKDVGPLCRLEGVKHCQALAEDAREKGASVLTAKSSMPDKGFFFRPTVVLNLNTSMRLWSEEAFGPIFGVTVVEDDARAVQAMNDSEYGLTASVFTKDEKAGTELLRQIDTGTSYLNCCDRVSPRLEWSGRQGSGIGTTLGVDGLKTMLIPRAFHLRKFT